jgi:hypothetical protein
MKFIRSGALALSIATSVGIFSTGPALALPLGPVAGGSTITARLDQIEPAVQVRYRGGCGGGGAIVGGIIGGMILGGIIASQQPYYYNAPPAYPVYGPAPYVGGDAVGYCMRRYRSFDPGSMTYLGFDGYRHPCP